jgi:hypothetical protein
VRQLEQLSTDAKGDKALGETIRQSLVDWRNVVES